MPQAPKEGTAELKTPDLLHPAPFGFRGYSPVVWNFSGWGRAKSSVGSCYAARAQPPGPPGPRGRWTHERSCQCSAFLSGPGFQDLPFGPDEVSCCDLPLWPFHLIPQEALPIVCNPIFAWGCTRTAWACTRIFIKACCICAQKQPDELRRFLCRSSCSMRLEPLLAEGSCWTNQHSLVHVMPRINQFWCTSLLVHLEHSKSSLVSLNSVSL